MDIHHNAERGGAKRFTLYQQSLLFPVAEHRSAPCVKHKPFYSHFSPRLIPSVPLFFSTAVSATEMFPSDSLQKIFGETKPNICSCVAQTHSEPMASSKIYL